MNESPNILALCGSIRAHHPKPAKILERLVGEASSLDEFIELTRGVTGENQKALSNTEILCGAFLCGARSAGARTSYFALASLFPRGKTQHWLAEAGQVGVDATLRFRNTLGEDAEVLKVLG